MNDPQASAGAAKQGFDPGGAAVYDGIYGLPHSVAEASVVVVPVPWDATTSYLPGTAEGPAAILEASRQVELFDVTTGRPYEAGIAMQPIPADIVAWNTEARRLAVPIIEAGGDLSGDASLAENLRRVNEFGDRVNAHVYAATRALLDAGKLPVVLGGDHSTPYGAIRACAERHPGLGVLHFDAHFDLRVAYEGFTWSHASIMQNVLVLGDVGRIVHVGIRDFSEAEYELSRGSGGRSVGFLDAKLKERADAGEPWARIAEGIAAELPQTIFVSFDIDGLDPVLCPGTGTPVPGGLAFHQAVAVIAAAVRRGCRIVGCDLNEVAPRDGDGEWNANVGARMLYKVIGYALMSRRAG